MGSETVYKLPLVDLSSENLKPGSSSWHSACNDIRKALEEYGCFEVVYKDPSIEFNNRVLAALEELFQLPQEIKMKNVNPKPGHGYVGNVPIVPIQEGMGIEYANNKDECQNFTNLMWPEGNDHFCDTAYSYTKIVTELQQLLVKMLFESYGIEKQIEPHIKSTTYLVRVLKYSRTKGESNLGFGEHTDKSFLSIVHQNHVKGLEMKTKDGNWVPYDPSSHSSFLVIAGDVCMAWSNDRIKSSHHRVIVDGEEVRYALALFSFLTGIIKTPEELVDEEHPLQYNPFEYQGLLDFYISSISQAKRYSNLVKAYCGV